MVLQICIVPLAFCEISTPNQSKKTIQPEDKDDLKDSDRKALRAKLEKDRLKGFIGLIEVIEKQDVPLKLLEMAWSDGLEDAKKTVGIKSPEYREMLQKCSAFYLKHHMYEEAENLYVRDMQDVVGFKTNRFDDLSLTKQQTALISEDMNCRAAVIELHGKRSREALEHRRQAIALLDKAGIPVNLDQRALLAFGFANAQDDNNARREYERYTKEAKNRAQKFSGLVSLARLEMRQKNYRLSLAYYDKVQKILGGPPMTDPFYPVLHLEMARTCKCYKRYEDAIGHYKQMLSYMEIKKPRPADIYAAAMNEMGTIYREQGEIDKYLKCVDSCVDYVTPNATTIDPWYAINPLLVAARLPQIDGRPYYKKAIALADQRKNKEGLLRCLLELGTYEQRDNWPVARERYYNAIALARRERLPLVAPLRQVGGQEYAKGNFKDALALFKEAAVEVKGTETEHLHPEVYADLLLRIAHCYACECNLKESNRLVDELVRYCQSTPEFKHDTLTNAMFFEARSNLAWLNGDYEKMEEYFAMATKLRRLNGVRDMTRVKNIINHMRTLHVKNCNEDMEPTLENALIGWESMRRELGPISAYRALLTKDLAQSFESAGKHYEAEVIGKKAEEDKKALLEHFN